MNGNELRVGNLANTSEMSGYNYQICRQGIIRTINNDSCNITPIKCSSPVVTVKFKNIEPIPLTEEWLLKFGFDKVGEWMGIDFNPRMGMRFYNGNAAECDITQDDKYIAFKCGFIQYVHQLQNLYFALTGNELELKP